MRAMLTTEPDSKWVLDMIEQPKHEGKGLQWYPGRTYGIDIERILADNGFDIVPWDQALYEQVQTTIKPNWI